MTPRQQIRYHNDYQKFYNSRIKAWAPKINKALKAQIQPTIATLRQSGVQAAIASLDMNVPMEQMGRVIKAIYTDAGRVCGGQVYQMVKKEGDKLSQQSKALMPIGYNEELTRDIINYFRLFLLSKAVVPISENTKDIILNILINAQEQGLSIQMIVNQLESDELTRQRARLIARTETNKAANWGAVYGARKSGYLTDKIWISARDNRTRRIPRDAFSHLAMNGVQVGLDETFKVPKKTGGVEELQQPGDPNGSAADLCNCRCTVAFKVKTDHAGRPLRRP